MTPKTMKAVVYKKVGGPEVLELVDVECPKPICDEVVIRVKACGLNLLDYYLRIEDDPDVPMPHILGSDIAGEVVELGEGVRDWEEGDEVIVSPTISCGHCKYCRNGMDSMCDSRGIIGYQTQGGYAEYAVVPARNLIKKPKSVTFLEASTLPLVAVTAYRMVFHQGHLHAGETVLVMGGSSGIGSLAIQLCKVAGAKVITTVGFDWKIQKAKEIGADEVINHSESDWFEQIQALTGGKGVNLILEHIGGEFLQKGIELLSQGGRLVTIGSTLGSEIKIDNFQLYRKQASIIGSYMGSISDLVEVTNLVEMGRVKPVVDKVFTLENVREAHERLQARKHFGKIVLKLD